MSATLSLTLSDAQLDDLANLVAKKLSGRPAEGRPLTQKETAQALHRSPSTVCRMIKAGVIRTVPGCTDRVPQSEIDRLLLRSAAT